MHEQEEKHNSKDSGRYVQRSQLGPWNISNRLSIKRLLLLCTSQSKLNNLILYSRDGQQITVKNTPLSICQCERECERWREVERWRWWICHILKLPYNEFDLSAHQPPPKYQNTHVNHGDNRTPAAFPSPLQNALKLQHMQSRWPHTSVHTVHTLHTQTYRLTVCAYK